MNAFTAAVFAAALILGGCGVKAISSEETDNPQVKADFIATVDGCRLWRVDTGSREIFLARCVASQSTSTQWDESCGKGCTNHRMSLTEGDRK